MKRDRLMKINDLTWEIPEKYKNCMRVPGRMYLSEELVDIVEEDTYEQVANVACLPGIVKYSLAMPEAHLGYGFPIGGVAGIDIEDGVISPGGVGFDINCGVKTLKTNLTLEDVQGGVEELINRLFSNIPSGVGSESKLKLSHDELDYLLENGLDWALENGYAKQDDVIHCEEEGCITTADANKVSNKAKKRGLSQVGTLGSGNHFLEVQYVDEVIDQDTAEKFGLTKNQIIVMIHTGSRGFGHQVCTDYVKKLEKATKKYNIDIPDKQLACAPFDSKEGQDYFAAMACAANYAWVNRQVIASWVRDVFHNYYGQDTELETLYDVAHNIAKKETHTVNGEKKELIVHRKGATRAFGPNHKELPSSYQETGQPVMIPGNMGAPSYILRGTQFAMENTFGSTCHGAGRKMSRSQAKREYWGETVQKELSKQKIYVKATHGAVIAEEAPGAYKNPDKVVNVAHNLGISKKVVKLKPLGVAKG
ncbi:RNA 3'-P ligase RtcB family protein [Methanonatronarchaeum thermophilum]|uniref:tRNA-splicing ligase RtcB n=1 Tax=Methanonatronarchaeum thermophilum TaxID=1927129 RepID=A0A1Y3GCE0_9EURY|nr:RtcB family protein [Methanonatronarchaeum thermophilum]OUJ19121.1 RNA 3'-P ligase RtcB family protein [Methanonatronarchaeum thermophilum]